MHRRLETLELIGIPDIPHVEGDDMEDTESSTAIHKEIAAFSGRSSLALNDTPEHVQECGECFASIYSALTL